MTKIKSSETKEYPTLAPDPKLVDDGLAPFA